MTEVSERGGECQYTAGTPSDDSRHTMTKLRIFSSPGVPRGINLASPVLRGNSSAAGVAAEIGRLGAAGAAASDRSR